MNKYIDKINKNPKIAHRIKELRVKKEYSWRAIAREISHEYPDVVKPYKIYGINCGKQSDGIDLCNAAMTYLEEDIVKDGWN